jgi:hypothetical protein
MLKNRTSAVAALLVGAGGAGLGLLPYTDGRWNAVMAWGCGATLLFAAFSASCIARAQPTRSVTHLLHDLENPAARQ